MAWAKRTIREALRPAPVVGGLLCDVFRSRDQLPAENPPLRQQLLVASRSKKRPAFRPHERGLLVFLSSIIRRWRDALLLVEPDTVIGWHREGFGLAWKRKSKAAKPRRSALSKETIELIQQMAQETSLWGAKLYDIGFRPILAFFIVNVNTKGVVHWAVTRAPTEQWTAQPLREATPYGVGLQALIRDGDKKHGADFDRVAEGAGIEVLQSAACTPRMNAVCERFLGGGRREGFEHLIVLGERHLRSVLGQYVGSYFNTARPYQGSHQRIPLGRHASRSDSAGKIVAFPVLNGLHHGYRRVA